MSGYTEWLCAQDCFQPMFGSDSNQMRFYKQGEIVRFPSSADEDVRKTSLFDMLEKNAPDPVSEFDDGDVTTYKDVDKSDENPVKTLGLTELQIAGLASEDIFTVGELRSCLAESAGRDRILESPHVRVGAATMARWCSMVGVKLEDEEEEQ